MRIEVSNDVNTRMGGYVNKKNKKLSVVLRSKYAFHA